MKGYYGTNIEEQPTRLRGCGGKRGAYHNEVINGKLVHRMQDGCRKSHTCEGCKVPIEKCRG